MRGVWAMARFHGASDWRWKRTLALFLFFFAAVWLLNDLDLRVARGGIPTASWTDLPLYVFSDTRFVYALVLAGGVLSTADHLPTALQQGTASLSAIRATSRSHWWLGFVFSSALWAMRFALLPMFAALLVGAMTLPLTTTSSYPGGARMDSGELFPALTNVPRPLLLLVITILTFAGVLLASLICLLFGALTRSATISALPVLLWIGIEAFSGFTSRASWVRAIDPLYNVLFARYVQIWQDGDPVGRPVPLTLGIPVLGLTVFLAIVLGLRRSACMDIR